MNYALICVEGYHDQAFIGKILRLFQFKDFRTAKEFEGQEEKLDPFWRSLRPNYPKEGGNLYTRLNMPSIFFNDNLSVALYVCEGSNLLTNLDDLFYQKRHYQKKLSAFGIIIDSDKKEPKNLIEKFAKLKEYFSSFPDQSGIVNLNNPKTGIYILPDNQAQGVLDSILCQCGDVVYPQYMERSRDYVNQFTEQERQQKPLKWGPFDQEKATIATVASVLKPGKTNTASISDNDWVCKETIKTVPELRQFVDFLRELLEIKMDVDSL